MKPLKSKLKMLVLVMFLVTSVFGLQSCGNSQEIKYSSAEISVAYSNMLEKFEADKYDRVRWANAIQYNLNLFEPNWRQVIFDESYNFYKLDSLKIDFQDKYGGKELAVLETDLRKLQQEKR
jgi:uncharacterized lipoprotein YehR (DUF1307 family)